MNRNLVICFSALFDGVWCLDYSFSGNPYGRGLPGCFMSCRLLLFCWKSPGASLGIYGVSTTVPFWRPDGASLGIDGVSTTALFLEIRWASLGIQGVSTTALCWRSDGASLGIHGVSATAFF